MGADRGLGQLLRDNAYRRQVPRWRVIRHAGARLCHGVPGLFGGGGMTGPVLIDEQGACSNCFELTRVLRWVAREPRNSNGGWPDGATAEDFIGWPQWRKERDRLRSEADRAISACALWKNLAAEAGTRTGDHIVRRTAQLSLFVDTIGKKTSNPDAYD